MLDIFAFRSLVVRENKRHRNGARGTGVEDEEKLRAMTTEKVKMRWDLHNQIIEVLHETYMHECRPNNQLQVAAAFLCVFHATITPRDLIAGIYVNLNA